VNQGARRSPTAASRGPRPERPSAIATIAVWVIIVMMVVPDGFDYAPKGLPTEGSTFSRLIWLSLLAFGAVVPLSRSAMALKLLRQINPFLLVFVLLVGASFLWSIEPGVTLRRTVRFTTTVLVAIAFVLMGWRANRFQSVVRPVLTAILLGSIIFVIMAPDLAIEQMNFAALIGAWHGLATQKNGLGSLASIALILWLHAGFCKERPWWMVALGGAVAVICLLKSRSSTSIMDAVFSCTLMVMLLRPPSGLRRYLPYMIVLFVSALLLYSLAVLNLIPGSGLLLSPITALSGKDLTFSGRTAIWDIVNRHIAFRPLLGSGYGAYWVQEPGSPSLEMIARLYFYPTEGHNGYLDIINDLGAVGALCLLGYLIKYLRQGMQLFASVRPQGILYLTLLFDQLIANLSESRWLNVLTVEFTIMTLATVAMARTLMDQQVLNRSTARASTIPSSVATPRRNLSRR
jgi:exopolysaccharide production protein ExoQ